MGELTASEILERCGVWLARIGRGNGYGIQSPSAFAFVHDVVCHVGKHEAYSRLHALRREHTASGPPERDDRLLFRLARYHNPKTALLFGQSIALTGKYMEAGCKNGDFYYLSEGSIEEVQNIAGLLAPIDLLYVDDVPTWPAVWEAVMPYASPNALFVIRGIHANRYSLSEWRQKTADKRVRTTYDLHFFGLASFEPRITKENYVVQYV